METPFTLYSCTETEPSQTELEFYQVELNEFLANSVQAKGDANSYTTKVPALVGTSGTVDQVVNHPVRPANTVTIRSAGNIIRKWHTMTLEQ
eukprot:scaffold4939_cov76-Amphora_coffeaeformis.AAC.1